MHEAVNPWAKRPKDRKPDSYLDGFGVDAPGRWSESGASYHGRSALLPRAKFVKRQTDDDAEVSRGRISCEHPQ